MEESWEEKTERLEREYQARIDRLREELREMESQLEAKDKRVAELEASVASNKHWFALAWNNLDRIHVLERLTADLQSQLEAKDKRVTELNHETMSWSEKVDTETYWQTGLRELEIQNAALTKRVAELERIVIDLNPEVNLLALYDMGVEEQLKTGALNRELLEEIEELKSQLEAKDKRVAELERFAKPGSYWFTRATELESQLAWTPVSAGLPTEPGVYYLQFRTTAKYKLKLYEDGESFSWTLLERPVADHPTEFDEYRCIELPKDGGT